MTTRESVELRKSRQSVISGIFDNLSEEEMDRYHEAFTMWDKNGNGRISINELGDFLENMGKEKPSEADLLDILNEFDQARSGGINFKQFLKFMTENQDNIDRKEELRRTFSAFDTDKDGFINKDDLKKVFKNLGISLEDEARILKIGDRKKLIITSQEVVVVKYSDH